jgi:hypothetical protein
MGELDESEMQEAMVSAGVPAVMAKLSLCGNDVMLADRLKKLGRDPDLQRAYLRVSVFDGKDMHIHSRSIDGLSLDDGRDIANGWGIWQTPQMDVEPDASSVDILKNQVYFEGDQMDIAQMHRLADGLVSAFDTLQTKRTGKLHKAGRTPEGADTYRFVLSNQDLLNAHLGSLSDLAQRKNLPIGHIAAVSNDLRYDIMSSFKQRLEGTWVDLGGLGESVAAAGDIERQAGTQYGGCDTVIGNQTAEMAGYLNGGGQTPGRAERQKITRELREEVVGKGACIACGAEGKLYGCRLCNACNKEWCEEYEKNGTQIPIKKLSRYSGGRPQPSPDGAESFGEYWDRLGKEIELGKLNKEADLANSA